LKAVGKDLSKKQEDDPLVKKKAILARIKQDPNYQATDKTCMFVIDELWVLLDLIGCLDFKLFKTELNASAAKLVWKIAAFKSNDKTEKTMMMQSQLKTLLKYG